MRILKIDIDNFMPEGVELATGRPEAVVLPGDKSFVVMRFAVKLIEPEPEPEPEPQADKH